MSTSPGTSRGWCGSAIRPETVGMWFLSGWWNQRMCFSRSGSAMIGASKRTFSAGGPEHPLSAWTTPYVPRLSDGHCTRRWS
jgi:hypothetical protein